MVNALAIGVAYKDFWHLNPYKLSWIFKGEAERSKRLDVSIYNWVGVYVQSAVATAVEHCLNGSKARSKYIDKPISYMQKESHSEDEMIAMQERLFAALEVQKINYELENKGEGE